MGTMTAFPTDEQIRTRAHQLWNRPASPTAARMNFGIGPNRN
jgi:hypothetical protein